MQLQRGQIIGWKLGDDADSICKFLILSPRADWLESIVLHCDKDNDNNYHIEELKYAYLGINPPPSLPNDIITMGMVNITYDIYDGEHMDIGRLLNIYKYNCDTEAIRLHPIVWIDLEMTGLDVERDHIIEVAVIITDGELNTVAEMEPIIIHQDDSVLNAMDEWCQQHHGKSGLTAQVRASTITIEQAEEQVLTFIKQYVTKPSIAPLAGNSVYMDKLFMKKEMKKVDEYLHYRIIDVSTLKELARRWKPSVLDHVVKKECHRALDDIRESISELRVYRALLFPSDR